MAHHEGIGPTQQQMETFCTPCDNFIAETGTCQLDDPGSQDQQSRYVDRGYCQWGQVNGKSVTITTDAILGYEQDI